MLNPADGTINTIWALNKTAGGSGDNEFRRLNATAIHPTSQVVYGVANFKNENGFNGGVEQVYASYKIRQR